MQVSPLVRAGAAVTAFFLMYSLVSIVWRGEAWVIAANAVVWPVVGALGAIAITWLFVDLLRTAITGKW